MADEDEFLRFLGTDVALKILACLDDSADLIRASSVSHNWRKFLIKNGLCKQLCLRKFPQIANVALIDEIDVGSSNSMHDREHRVYASLFKALTAIEVTEILAHAIRVSGTDNYLEESIRNTEVPETLIYQLGTDFCVITEINILPIEAYSSKSVRFRMGHKDFDDEKYIWTYTSQDFPMSQENHPKNFKLAEPVLCIGGFLQIELLGRVRTQASVSCVEVLGRPLPPAFLVDNLRPSGEFDLKYSPEALLSTLRNDSLATASSVASPPEHREHRMQGHLRGLVRFRMQRNEQGVELIEGRMTRTTNWIMRSKLVTFFFPKMLSAYFLYSTSGCCRLLNFMWLHCGNLPRNVNPASLVRME